MLADLHRHLDGSLRRSTLDELARERGLSVPADLAFRAGMGLDEALSRFRFTLSLLQDPRVVARVAREICEDADREGVTTLEVRFAPQLHGGSLEEVTDAALSGLEGRAGLILCGLYGEPPEVLEALVRVAEHRPGVTGIDLAGGPAGGHSFGMRSYAASFARARDLGIGRTLHAGEGRPPAEIRVAIEELFAQRIGHGTTLLDDPSVLDLVRERGVTIEACLTSNVHTGAVSAVEEHPLARWLELGVRACVNTDNTLLSETSSPVEHAIAGKLPGMTRVLLERAIAHGHAAAFRREH